MCKIIIFSEIKRECNHKVAPFYILAKFFRDKLKRRLETDSPICFSTKTVTVFGEVYEKTQVYIDTQLKKGGIL